MRDVAVTEGDKVEAQLRFGVSVNTYGVNDLVAAVDAVADADVDELVAEYEDSYRRRARTAPGRRAARVAALRRPDRGRPARLPRRRRLRRLHHQLRGPRRAAAAARPRRAAADGRRLRLRRRGRLEDLGAAAHAVKAMARRPARRHVVHGGLHLPPRPGRAEDPRRAHARGLPDHRRGHAERARSTRSASATGRTRSGWSSTPRPARPSWSGSCDMGDRFRLVANEIDVVAPDEPLPKLPVRGRSGSPRRTCRPRRRCGSPPVARTTPCCHQRSAPRTLRDFAEMVGTELLVIDADTTPRAFADEHPLEPGLLPAGPRPDRSRLTRPSPHHFRTIRSPVGRPLNGEKMKIARLATVAAEHRARPGPRRLWIEREDRRPGSRGRRLGRAHRRQPDRRHHADQVVGALDRRRRQHQGRVGGARLQRRPAVRENDIPTQVNQIEYHDHQRREGC